MGTGRPIGLQHRHSCAAMLRLLCPVCVLALLSGCGAGGPGQPAEVQRTDSAGVELVIAPGRLLDHLPVRALAPVPVLAIADEELEEFPLSRIGGALILPDRKVAIGDQTLAQIAVVGSSGDLRHRFGRKGRGPGELSGLSGLRRRAEDELVVWDGARGQLVVFDTAGAFREQVQTPMLRTAQRMLPFPGFLADGSPIFERREIEWVRHDGAHRREFIVDRYRPDGAFDSALVSIPGQEAVGYRSGRSWFSAGVVFAGSPRLTVGGGRAFLGHGERFEIQTWSAAGLERVVRIDRARKPASRADQSAARDSVVASFARSPFGKAIQLNRSDVVVRDSFPAFEDLHATAEGGLWIKETGKLHEGPPSWIILDQTGEPTARIHTPMGFTVLDIRGDLVLGVVLDEFDIPTVLLYRIETGA